MVDCGEDFREFEHGLGWTISRIYDQKLREVILYGRFAINSSVAFYTYRMFRVLEYHVPEEWTLAQLIYPNLPGLSSRRHTADPLKYRLICTQDPLRKDNLSRATVVLRYCEAMKGLYTCSNDLGGSQRSLGREKLEVFAMVFTHLSG